jgi:hypothetical protein
MYWLVALDARRRTGRHSAVSWRRGRTTCYRWWWMAHVTRLATPFEILAHLSVRLWAAEIAKSFMKLQFLIHLDALVGISRVSCGQT